MARLVRNQCMNVPSAGIMCGYCRVFCACRSCSLSGGPGYCRGRARRRDGCEGGLNRSGFSSTRGLGGALDAYRVDAERSNPCCSCLECRLRLARGIRWRRVAIACTMRWNMSECSIHVKFIHLSLLHTDWLMPRQAAAAETGKARCEARAACLPVPRSPTSKKLLPHRNVVHPPTLDHGNRLPDSTKPHPRTHPADSGISHYNTAKIPGMREIVSAQHLAERAPGACPASVVRVLLQEHLC